MKKLILPALIAGLFVLSPPAESQDRLEGFLWIHATDCTALTSGQQGDKCFETDAELTYTCNTADGLCNTAAEWDPDTVPAANISGVLADANVDGSLEADELILAGDVSGAANANVVDDVQSATTNLEAADNNTTQVASTSFVQQEINGAGGTNLSCSSGQCNVDAVFLLLTGGTLTGEMVADDLGIEFTPGDTLTDCSTFAATGGGIFYDDSEGKFKKCEDNVLTDLAGAGASPGGDADDIQINDGGGGFTGDGGFEYNLGASTLDLDGVFTLTQSGGIRDTDSIDFSHDGTNADIDVLSGYLGFNVDQIRQYGTSASGQRWLSHVQTTNATQTEMLSDTDGSRIGVAANSMSHYEVWCGAYNATDDESGGYGFKGTIDNHAGTTALASNQIKSNIGEDVAAWGVVVDADDTNDALRIQVTGEASTTIDWVCTTVLTSTSTS